MAIPARGQEKLSALTTAVYGAETRFITITCDGDVHRFAAVLQFSSSRYVPFCILPRTYICLPLYIFFVQNQDEQICPSRAAQLPLAYPAASEILRRSIAYRGIEAEFGAVRV